MTANDVNTIPEPLRDRSRLFVLRKLTASDAAAHFDRLIGGDQTQVSDLARCRDFMMNLADRPEGISLRRITQLANPARAPMPRMVH